MTKTRLLTLCLAACLIASISVWMINSQSELPDASAPGNTASSEAETTEAKNASVPSTEPASQSADASSAVAQNSEQNIVEPSATMETTSEANPFTVEEPTLAKSDDPATGANPVQPDALEAEKPVIRNVVEVPASYAVEDAAKYFVPANERGPGNLGGPPPLPDANTLGGETINPPTMPSPVLPEQ